MPSRLNPLHLSVRTASGHHLGQIVDIEIDPDMHTVVSYHVKTNRLVPNLVSAPLMIAPTQVISISEKEMVVEDALSGEKAPAPQPL